ncbi:MAG: hypothetical protein WCA30_05290 [Dermatophilaceae bacterium]
MESIDTGDQVVGRKRRAAGPEGVEDTEGHVFRRGEGERRRVPVMSQPSDEVEDTEGHVFRTYPGASPDEPPECRSPLPGDEEDRLGRI